MPNVEWRAKLAAADAWMTNFDRACQLLETVLTGDVRRQIVKEASGSKNGRALHALRGAMRANVLKAGGRRMDFDSFVSDYDRRTREDGFHVLHDWDGKADDVNAETIPVDVANYLIDRHGDPPADPIVLAILLDYYLMHLLGLLTLRIWDAGDANANLDRVERLLGALQGPAGSGQPFAANAETLLLIATAHFEIHERGYQALLEKVGTLDEVHRANIALGHAASIGCHLRFGFEATYGRDTVVMRDDNVADYPWLRFAVTTLIEEYSRRRADAIAEGILNGLSADPKAFVNTSPFGDLFHAHADELLEAFERFRPSERTYSPLSFFFNFSHNVVKGTIVDALVRGSPWNVTLNDLLTGLPCEGESGPRQVLATTLMGYARRNPDRIRGQLTPVIVYDPRAGRQAYGIAMRKLREAG
jgi:hypothetical protein